jgi:predicted nucleic acid-binding protein
MRNFFVDANIVIDWLNADSEGNELCTQVIQTIVAITYYIISKSIRNKALVLEKLKSAFAFFNISTEDEQVGRAALESNFKDLEDAIQYYSALKSKADAIITFNTFDFSGSKIPVLHPAEFMQLHTIH